MRLATSRKGDEMTRTAVRTITIVLALLFISAAVTCESNRAKSPRRATVADGRIAAANAFTRRYEQSRFSQWNIHANAAGTDCDVLYVTTSSSSMSR